MAERGCGSAGDLPHGFPATPAAARVMFGPRVGIAERYVRLLATAGIARGLIGPRETDRLWDRHLLNCGALADLVPQSARIVDVGSGAGLPGIPLAIRRPDLAVTLVESLRRRFDFLDWVVTELGLRGTVRVLRGRAEDASTVTAVGGAEFVTARAVAPLDRLCAWCLPLLRPNGLLLAIKGDSAEAEIREHLPSVRACGGESARLVRVTLPGDGGDSAASTVSVIVVRRSGGRGPRGRSA